MTSECVVEGRGGPSGKLRRSARAGEVRHEQRGAGSGARAGAGEVREATSLLARLPTALLAACLSDLCARSFFRAAQTCSAVRDCARRPAASPTTVEGRIHRIDEGSWFPDAGRPCDDMPESLLRLRPQRLLIHALILPRHLCAIAARMHADLRHLCVRFAVETRVSLTCLASLMRLTHLEIQGHTYIIDVTGISRLPELEFVSAPLSMPDTVHLPAACRRLELISWRDHELLGFAFHPNEHLSAWRLLMQRPLRVLRLGFGLGPDELAALGTHARTLESLEIGTDDVRPLAALPHLVDLTLSPPEWHVERLRDDDGLSTLTGLRSLKLWTAVPRPVGLACLAALTNLTALDLSAYPADEAGVAALRASRPALAVYVRPPAPA